MVSVGDTQRKYIQLEVRSFMINTQIETAARLAIRDNPKKRVLPLSVEGKTYYIKRLISNGRNKLVKQGAHAAYLTEVYKIMEVNERLPLAPHIVLLTDDFFVMEACGKPLQRIVKEHDATAEEAYYQAGCLVVPAPAGPASRPAGFARYFLGCRKAPDYLFGLGK